MITNMTKIEMARVIVQALLNMPQLPDRDHRLVKQQARQFRDDLVPRHKLAAFIVARNARLRAEGVAP